MLRSISLCTLALGPPALIFRIDLLTEVIQLHKLLAYKLILRLKKSFRIAREVKTRKIAQYTLHHEGVVCTTLPSDSAEITPLIKHLPRIQGFVKGSNLIGLPYWHEVDVIRLKHLIWQP